MRWALSWAEVGVGRVFAVEQRELDHLRQCPAAGLVEHLPANGNWGVALEEFGADAVYSHTFTEPGAYDYYCTVHGTKTRGMIGKVVVTE